MLPFWPAVEFWDTPEQVSDIPFLVERLTPKSAYTDPKTVFDDNIAKAPQTQAYKEHAFEAALQPEESPEWTVELAQFAVPQGFIGVLKDLDQVLFDGFDQLEGIIPPVDGLRWILRTEPYHGIMPARLNVAAANPDTIPGTSAEVPDLRYLWYPAQRLDAPLNLIIQGATILRFYFYSPAVPLAEYRWRVLGRLRGFIQSEYYNDSGALLNARKNW